MAIYRNIQTNFWQDGFVTELTPEEKYFYFYLLTNSRTTQCGIYEFNRILSEAETGYSRETLDKLIKRFQEYGKILYSRETKEIILLNWVKYNYINSRNTIKCINKELKKVKSKNFINILYKKCSEMECNLEGIFENIVLDIEEKGNGNNAVHEEIGEEVTEETAEEDKEKKIERGFQGAYKDLGEKEKEIQKEKEEEASPDENIAASNSEAKQEESEKLSSFEKKAGSRALIEFNKNIREATRLDLEKIGVWRSNFEEEVIIQAIYEAVKYKVKSTAYVDSILKNWGKSGITTMKKFNAHKGKYKEKDSKINIDAYKYLD